MSFSLASLAQTQWDAPYGGESDLLVVIPATRETGLLANRLYFRLMNLPQGVNAHVIFYETDFKVFREDELGYRSDDYRFGSRAYVLAERMLSDKIHTYAVLGTSGKSSVDLKGTMLDVIQENDVQDVIFYGLSSSNYQTHFFHVFDWLLERDVSGVLGVYVTGDGQGGLEGRLVNQKDDALGTVNRPIDDAIQTQLTISTFMFNTLNKWVSGTPLGTNKVGIDLGTGEINPKFN